MVKVVTFDGTPDGDWVISLADLEQLGAAHLAQAPSAVDDRIGAIEPQHLATLIYTSGTTGRPKGVRLSHDSWTYEAAAVDALGILSKDDLQYLWLPLSHVFGKVLLALPMQVGFPTAVDGRVDKIVDNLGVVTPTFVGAAPRIFEKAYGRITTTVDAEGGREGQALRLGLPRGSSGCRPARRRALGVRLLAAQYVFADRLVLQKVRDRFGGRIRFFISGSAALNSDVAQWFEAAGLLILEGYGLTESSAASFVNRPTAYAFGSVGLAMPGTQVRIAAGRGDPAQGPGRHGGLSQPARGHCRGRWTATGGCTRGTSATSTSAGSCASPTARRTCSRPLAASTSPRPRSRRCSRGMCPYAGQLVVHGNGRNFVSALVTLDPEAMDGLGGRARHGRQDVCRDRRAHRQVREMVQGYIDELNAKLNRWETIKKFVILPRDLSVEEGDLTPSMKLKRSVVAGKYKDELDSLYSLSGLRLSPCLKALPRPDSVAPLVSLCSTASSRCWSR